MSSSYRKAEKKNEKNLTKKWKSAIKTATRDGLFPNVKLVLYAKPPDGLIEQWKDKQYAISVTHQPPVHDSRCAPTYRTSETWTVQMSLNEQ